MKPTDGRADPRIHETEPHLHPWVRSAIRGNPFESPVSHDRQQTMNQLASIPHQRTTANRFQLQGCVQGRGVRPAIVRLAAELQLHGFVANRLGGVEVHVEGDCRSIGQFAARLQSELPAAADVQQLRRSSSSLLNLPNFEIRTAESTGTVSTFVPQDLAVCPQCINEVADAADRRAGYAFTSCTNCGPRYSIIETMPYERSQTTMRFFELCEDCRAEYTGFDDRRFHAQTNACTDCGPAVWCEDALRPTTACGQDAIGAAAKMLNDGGIVALKGIGGYQLLCDATNEPAVRRLRDRKRRRSKPLPIMIDAANVRAEFPAVFVAASNPIVLVASHLIDGLAASVHPNLNTVGVMLPTTPLHWLLLWECGGPLVVTSGNTEGEPLAYENDEAIAELHDVADLFLHHNRAIARPIDDSVVQTSGNRTVTIRAARGIAPLPLDLQTERSILAVGGHQKVAVALSNGKQSVLGPHIGDLDSLAARERFVSHTKSLIKLYGTEPEVIVHDLHPDYFTTRWAAEQPQPTIAVQHHHAHVVSGMLEHGWLDRTVLGVAFDGTGYGTDGTVWGGEFLVATATGFQRVAHLRPFVLPGGELAVRQPWRVALSMLTDAAGSATTIELLDRQADQVQLESLAKLVERRRSGPVTTSAGRLFDGVSALLLSLADASFAGEPAMRLEAVCDVSDLLSYSIPITVCREDASSNNEQGRLGLSAANPQFNTLWGLAALDPSHPIAQRLADLANNTLQLDWRPMLVQIVADLDHGVDVGAIAMRFHRSMAGAIVRVVREFVDLPIVLSGGCFQNRVLTDLVGEQLADHSQLVGFPGVIPPNDGGLAAGQLAIAAARLEETQSNLGAAACV